MEDDWRLAGNEKLFRGAVFFEKRYTQWSPKWDHDHCSFCGEPFTEEGSEADRPDAHHKGFSTPGPPRDPKDDYYWVCRGASQTSVTSSGGRSDRPKVQQLD